MTYLDYFREICSIPHGSKNTKMISDYLVNFAKEHNFEYYQDELNNVVIIKEASEGRENDEPIILQGHMDMVAVKDDDCDKDMTKDGLTLFEDGDFLGAKGTSLGADDGIAVAYALAILSDESLKLPRIELVVTVDEEIGMEGATAIDLSMLKGHILLNLDSEEEGKFLASCAGGARVDFVYKFEESDLLTPGEGNVVYEINISNLIGGHSGSEIDKNRANAIRLMCKILKKLDDTKFVCGIGDFEGGTADNAICNACKAIVLCKPIEPELFDIVKYEVLDSFMAIEKNAKITISEIKSDKKFYQSSDFLHFLMSLPNGVQAMSQDMEGLVETSLNHGIIRMNDAKVNISLSVRSSINEKKEELIKTLKELSDNHPVEMNVHGNYPGWAYRKDSPLRDRMVSLYEEMFGEKAEVLAIHAGLECGILSEKISNLDCVSYGPQMRDIHTTKERLSLSSAKRMYDFTVRLLTE